MKRDFDLLRSILFEVENLPPLQWHQIYAEDGQDHATYIAHVELLIEAKLVNGEVTRVEGQGVGKGIAVVTGLTWAGHDFLDAMKNDTVWLKARENILKPLGGVAFDVLKEWLKAEMRQKLQIPI
jgi:hypothetical protein